MQKPRSKVRAFWHFTFVATVAESCLWGIIWCLEQMTGIRFDELPVRERIIFVGMLYGSVFMYILRVRWVRGQLVGIRVVTLPFEERWGYSRPTSRIGWR